jgi:hypothetical protein
MDLWNLNKCWWWRPGEKSWCNEKGKGENGKKTATDARQPISLSSKVTFSCTYVHILKTLLERQTGIFHQM